LVLLPIVSAILFVRTINMVLVILFYLFFGNIRSIPILLLLGALVLTVENNITVTERVKIRTVVLHLKLILLQCLLINIYEFWCHFHQDLYVF